MILAHRRIWWCITCYLHLQSLKRNSTTQGHVSIPAPVIGTCANSNIKPNIMFRGGYCTVIYIYPPHDPNGPCCTRRRPYWHNYYGYLGSRFVTWVTITDEYVARDIPSLGTPFQRRRPRHWYHVCIYEPLKFYRIMPQCLLHYYFWQHHIAEAPTTATYRQAVMISCPTRRTTWGD